MKIETAVGAARGAMGYMVYDHAGGSAAIIDAPYGTAATFRKAAEQAKVEVLYIVSTHGHWDQIAENVQLEASNGGSKSWAVSTKKMHSSGNE